MAAISVTCTGVVKQANGGFLLNFADNSQKEFASLADLYNYVFGTTLDAEVAIKWMVMNWLNQDPAAAAPNTYMTGHTCIFNQNVPSVSVQKAV